MEFIATLVNEHQQIVKYLQEIESLANQNQNCLLPLKEFEAVLAHHLKKEDEILYPRFSSSEVEELNKLGKMFSDQMKIYSIEIVDCLAAIKKAKGLMDEDLKQRFIKINKRIKSRVTIEEDILFPAYDKYFN